MKPWSHLPDYVYKAFTYAREADPNVLLFYNDYNMLYEGKSDHIVTMIKDMHSKKVPIDGIGIQFHVEVGND